MNFYVATSIAYVNAEPHIGYALELVQADVLARHRRLRGEQVRFQTGTDDNAFKNVTAARAARVDVHDFVKGNAARFAALREPLDLSYDDFVSTSSDPRHFAGVEKLWRASAERGDFYRKSYTGYYCSGCEAFVTEPYCPEHGTKAEIVTEENWFFRLSKYQDQILHALEHDIRIEPEARRNEVLSFVRSGLSDISVSRPAARSNGWGIPVPGDPSQVIYVWWDALANYITTLGDSFDQWWRDGEQVHVIGKGIIRFHAVYWPALLLSAGLPLPKTIFVHEYLTSHGAKISKSSGVRVSPVDLIDKYGVDAVRWWLLREPAKLGDTDFTEERLVDRSDGDLANGVGNLFNRVRGLAGGSIPTGPSIDLASKVDAALHDFDFRAATAAIVAAVDEANRLIETTRPWELSGPERDEVLARLGGACRTIAHELAPFLPSGADRVLNESRAFPRLADRKETAQASSAT
ncbi:methionine--tRNA ligase [Kibdelosporangium philippinense]|uniref:methionine--tRNA ligase n=1 Tax=Kibdelosporangium philippinense TaxID=211113 RepID=A0ABS8ZDL2_9PSEU|nr:methionine--tRNA ligase [Kibdelosporangium philippinense]MCE7005924.1 methionine--tRNA ligase [Kibdelosporangium philippinense]